MEHLCKPGSAVSAHFVVGRGGEVVQLVRVEDTAWHCSGWNARSVGIEHVARTPGELDRRGRWARMSAEQRAKLLDEGADAVLLAASSDPGMLPTSAQLDASAALVRWLLRHLGLDVNAVVGHCDNPKTTHLDCGLDVEKSGIWPWADYRRRLELLDPVAVP